MPKLNDFDDVMNDYIRYTILSLFLLIALVSKPQTLSNEANLVNQCSEDYAYKRLTETKEGALKLLKLASTTNSESANIYGTAYYTLYATSAGEKSGEISNYVKTLNSKISELESKKRDKELMVASKALGLYYQFEEQNYSLASSYDFKALKAARQLKDHHEEVDILCNLSSNYFQKNDSTGISYAISAYNIAKDIKYEPGIYRSGCNIANYLYNKGEVESCLRYLQAAKALAVKLNFTREMQYLDSFLGDVYSRLGKNTEAEEYYKNAITDRPETTTYDKLYARICYALFLHKTGRYQEAIKIYQDVESKMNEYGVTTFASMVYYDASTTYESLNNPAKALLYYKKYMEEQLNLISAENEKEFSILDLKYRLADEKEKNASQKVELVMKEKRMTLLISVIGLFMVVIIFLLILHSRNKKRYQSIVSIHLNYLKEQQLKSQAEQNIPDKDADKIDSWKYANSALSEEKGIVLFNQIKSKMSEEKVYRDSSLSVDKLASILGTNRSYLSQVINKYAQTSYSIFVNNYRLKEAIEILSDPTNDEPLKSIYQNIGYKSSSSFYQSFKDKIGVSPSIYREQCRKLQKGT